MEHSFTWSSMFTYEIFVLPLGDCFILIACVCLRGIFLLAENIFTYGTFFYMGPYVDRLSLLAGNHRHSLQHLSHHRQHRLSAFAKKIFYIGRRSLLTGNLLRRLSMFAWGNFQHECLYLPRKIILYQYILVRGNFFHMVVCICSHKFFYINYQH
jgi:hypothetical protein